jgi:SPW repeat
MDRGPIPLNMHAALEPFIAVLVIAAPWIFGFSETDSATVICVLVGVAMLLVGSMTDWRMSLMRVIPLRMHLAGDLLLGAVLLLSPFVFGFADDPVHGDRRRARVADGADDPLGPDRSRTDVHARAPDSRALAT